MEWTDFLFPLVWRCHRFTPFVRVSLFWFNNFYFFYLLILITSHIAGSSFLLQGDSESVGNIFWNRTLLKLGFKFSSYNFSVNYFLFLSNFYKKTKLFFIFILQSLFFTDLLYFIIFIFISITYNQERSCNETNLLGGNCKKKGSLLLLSLHKLSI